jgi:hypothetical protein
MAVFLCPAGPNDGKTSNSQAEIPLLGRIPPQARVGEALASPIVARTRGLVIK